VEYCVGGVSGQSVRIGKEHAAGSFGHRIADHVTVCGGRIVPEEVLREITHSTGDLQAPRVDLTRFEPLYRYGTVVIRLLGLHL
jgi:hypothetical protein